MGLMPMQKGTVIVVQTFTDEIKGKGPRIGEIISIRDVAAQPIKLNSWKKNPSLDRSRYLITCKDENEKYFSFYGVDARYIDIIRV